MKKDRISSVILICLVISSIVLTVKIWFSEELWPDGYNFFVTPEKILSSLPFMEEKTERSEAVAPLHETMLMPEKIVAVQSVSQRKIYSGSDDDFVTLNNFAKSLLTALFTSEPAKTAISATELCDTIKSSSLYVEYPVSMPVKVLGHLCEINESPVFSDVYSVNGFVAVPTPQGCSIYLYDNQSRDAYMYSFPFDGSELSGVISKYSPGGGDFMSAYELGFYKREDMEVEQKLSFAPLVFMDTSGKQSESTVIKGTSPFDKTEPSALSLEAINGIVSAFGYNPNTIRRYTDEGGTLVLVEDYSTIKLHPTGLMEFTTTTPKKGINMKIHSGSAESPQNIPDTIDSITEILAGVWSALDMGEMPDIRLSSDIPDNFTDFGLCFDYRYGGYPVRVSFAGAKHAIEIEVKNNLLVSMKVYIRSYSSTSENSENLSTLEALDRFCEEPDINSDAKNLFLGYIDYGTAGKIYAHWNVSGNDGSISFLRR